MSEQMRTLNITIEDFEYAALARVKGERTWHDLIMTLIKE